MANGLSFAERLQATLFGKPTSASDLVDVDSNQAITNKTIAGSAGVPYLKDITGTGANKIAYGSSALVSGVKLVATGLSTVLAFQAEPISASFATGATEVATMVVSGATGVIATGDVTVQGLVLATTTKSVSGTGLFFWTAIGT